MLLNCSIADGNWILRIDATDILHAGPNLPCANFDIEKLSEKIRSTLKLFENEEKSFTGLSIKRLINQANQIGSVPDQDGMLHRTVISRLTATLEEHLPFGRTQRTCCFRSVSSLSFSSIIFLLSDAETVPECRSVTC